MSFDNNTNHGRAAKIVEIMELVEKSASSNKVPTSELATMLAPVVSKLNELGVLDVTAPADENMPETPTAPVQSANQPKWVSLRQMAETAPLKDLSVAMAVIMNRFDAFVDEHDG